MRYGKHFEGKIGAEEREAMVGAASRLRGLMRIKMADEADLKQVIGWGG